MHNLNSIIIASSFERQQDWRETTRIIHAERVEQRKGKVLDLELLFNQIKLVFKPDEEQPEVDRTQAALSAQVHCA